MNKRWSISLDGGATWVAITPSNEGRLKIIEAPDLDNGQVFFRKKLTGNVILSGNDYLLVRPFEVNPALRCNTLLMRVEIKCGASWREFWRGDFSAGSGKWDLGNCTFQIKPETVDRYSCLLRKMNVKHNILQVAPTVVKVYALPSLEFGTCTTVGFTPAPSDGCDQFYESFPGSPFINGWDGATTSQVAPGDSQVNFYWREKVETECVGGNPVPPPGSGWVLLSNDCGTTGTAVYARQPLISWPFDPPQAGTVVNGVNVPPDNSCNWVYMGMGGVDDPFTPEQDAVPYYVCINSASSQENDAARPISSVLQYLVDKSGCGLAGVRSDFYEINPPGDAIGYSPGTNYVTGGQNQHNALVMLQKSDAKNPTATNPATIGEMTLAEMFKFLLECHQVYWTIDNGGYVRLEHWNHWTRNQGIDIRTLSDTVEPLAYKHSNEKTPRIERGRWMEALGRDFVGKDIIYNSPCASPEDESGSVLEHSPGRITTDISYVLTDPVPISNDGFVVLATRFDGASYNTIIDQGAITGNFISNAPMSWANLQRDFWTWNRFLLFGEMNGAAQIFDGIRPNITQDKISIALCCQIMAFDPRDYLTTELGQRLGGLGGIIESLEYDLVQDRIEITTQYTL